MHDTIAPEYRIDLHRDQPRAIRRREAKKALQREAHTLVLHVTSSGVPEFFADWWYDLRRQQLRIYGALLRFIDISVMRRVPKAVLKMIPKWIDAYIEDQYDNDNGDPPATTKRAA